MPTRPMLVTSVNAAIRGMPGTPISAVKISSAPTSLSLKNRSTRYLSMWVEMAHRTGPQNAQKNP